MLHNYLKITFRNIIKSPVYFLINLLGLSVGLASCLIIFQYVYYESSYENFIPRKEDIKRISYHDHDSHLASTPVPLAPTLKSEFANVQHATRFIELKGLLQRQGSPANEEPGIIMADEEFFEVFNFDLVAGDKTSLSQPDVIYISRKIADKYFKEENALGNKLTLLDFNFGEREVEVAGVFENIPSNTHMPFEIVLSLASIVRDNSNNPWATVDNWGWNPFYTYVLMSSGNTISQDEFNTVIDQVLGKEGREESGMVFKIQDIGSIHLKSDLSNEYQENGNARAVYLLGLVALLILSIACINYINLSSAKGLERVKEIGIRKNLGARRRQLISQFIIEALVICGFSLLLGITLIQGLEPVIAAFIPNVTLGDIFTSPEALLITLVPLLVGIGWVVLQPAWLISSFSLVDMTKGKMSGAGLKRSYIKWSVILQFGISMILLISCYIIYSQVSYMQNKALGINIDQVLIVERPLGDVTNYEQKAQRFKNELVSRANIDIVSTTASIPSQGYNWSTNGFYKKGESKEDNSQSMNVTYVDNNFTKIYNIKVVAGEGSSTGEAFKSILLNRSAAEVAGIVNLEEAIGAVLIQNNEEYIIKGIIDNYNHRSIKTSFEPTVFILDNQIANYYSIRFNTEEQSLSETKSILNLTKSIYMEIFPDQAFGYFFLDEAFAAKYKSEFEFGWIILTFSLLAVLLACLGLFGLSLFSLSKRTKEIGIRKTLGASIQSLLVYLFKDYALLVFIAMIPAVPVAYYLVSEWLHEYPFRIELDISHFLFPAIALFVIALATASYHVVKLTNTNPIDSLKYE